MRRERQAPVVSATRTSGARRFRRALPLFVKLTQTLVRIPVLVVQAREPAGVARGLRRSQLFADLGEPLLDFGDLFLDRLLIARAPLLLRPLAALRLRV